MITFRDGRQVCPLGQGTYQMGRRRAEEIQALRRGIDLGLTLIDTAEMYGNEEFVGEGRLSCNQTLERIAKRHKATPAQIALAWTMRSPGIIAIPKAGSISHVNDNYNSLTVTLNDEDQAHIDAAFPPPRKKIPLAGW